MELPLKLKVEVLRARNLIAADVNGKSDPYCRVCIGQKIFNTSVQPNTLNPEWQQSIAFINEHLSPFALLQGSESSAKLLLLGYLVIEVWDHDFGNPDDFLGRLVLPLSSLPLCPVQQVDIANEVWYQLNRISNKDITGDLQLKVHLEAVEDDVMLANMKLNEDLYTVTTALGYQLPVLLDDQIVQFPGATEVMEIGFSKVYVEVGAYHSEAVVILTNYRLIILSVGELKGATCSYSTILPGSSYSDLNMWIALNNIANVEQGTGSTVVRRHVSGGAENVESITVTIYCYDSRTVQIVFVMNSEAETIPTLLPQKLLKRVTEQALNLEKYRPFGRAKIKRKLRKLKRALPHKTKGIDARHRSGAFAKSERQHKSILEECQDVEFMDPAYQDEWDSFDDDDEEEEEEQDSEHDCFPVLEPDKQQISILEQAYQGLTLPSPTKPLVSSFILRLDDITANIADNPPAFNFLSSDLHKDTYSVRWDVNSIVLKDMQRFMSDKWRTCAINSQDYGLCPSYPPLIFIPAEVPDPLMEEVAKFRSKGRIPSLVWMDKKNDNFLMRSAQPLTGPSGKHCKDDERLLQIAMTTGPVGGGMTIFDARSFAAVQGNKIMGKGTEDVSHYINCKLVYLDIPNIHAVRDSYDNVRTLVLSSSNSKWLSNLENTQWLNYISLILKGSLLIAQYLKLQDGSALVHCSDGWDRTAQLTSLTQLMIDSYYRTIDGFMVLIAKEWLAYGHKFHDRLGHPLHPNERSPIFMQFLDCVHQLIHQYSTTFEYTQSLLLCICEHINTAWFGTFLCNCDKERLDKKVFHQTLPLSVHINAMRDNFININYKETSEILTPSWTVRRLRLWEEYFLAWDGTSIPPLTPVEMEVNITEGQDGNNTVVTEHKEGDTVVWMADEKTKACLLCHQKFSVVRRKHHCRNCGRIFCNECSKHRAALTRLGYDEPVRVCDQCFRIYNNTVQQSTNVEAHSEDGFQVLEVKKRTTTT